MRSHHVYSYSLLGAKITGCLCVFWLGMTIKVMQVGAPSAVPPSSVVRSAISTPDVGSHTPSHQDSSLLTNHTSTQQASRSDISLVSHSDDYAHATTVAQEHIQEPMEIESPTMISDSSPVVDSVSNASLSSSLSIPDSLVSLEIAAGVTPAQQAIVIPMINELVQWYDEHLTTDRKLSQQLQTIIINADSSTVQRCQPKTVRGCSSHSIVEINLSQVGNEIELKEVLAHEFAHIVDLGIIVGSSPQKSSFTEFGNKNFANDDPSLEFYQLCRSNEKTRKPDCGELSFVGGYAMTNPFEDWAETVNMYLHHYSYLQAMARTDPILAKKVDIVYRLFGGRYRGEHPISDRSATERRRDSTQL